MSAVEELDLLAFAKLVEEQVRGDDRLSDALDCAKPYETDNIRALRSVKHGAVEVTFRFDAQTWKYGRQTP